MEKARARRAAVGMRRNHVKGYLGVCQQNCKLDYGALVRKMEVARIHLAFRTG